jgi:hypothetical protein
MLNVLKFTYSFAGESQVHTKVHSYLHLVAAEAMFDHLRLAYQFDASVKVKGGRRIKILSVNLYTSFHEDKAKAEAEVLAGHARLIQEAHPVEIDLGDQAP